MKERTLLLAIVLLLGLMLIPAQLFAAGNCSYPEYSNCGTALGPVTFTLTNVGFAFPYIEGDWYGFDANFTESVYVHDITTGYIGPGSYTNQSNPAFGTPTQLTMPLANVHYGDQIEFVLHVTSDPNFPQGVDYCWGMDSCYKDYNGNTQIGHVFAQNLPANDCNQGVPCVFMGFEDLPTTDGNAHSDWDYNDFEFYVYGVSINGQSAPVPEPSSVILLAGAPLAFAIRKLKNMI